jgi:hypothetical protein
MNARIAMRQLFSPGSLVLFLFFLTGIWVFISPFAMTTQPSGIHWIPSTINNIAVGGVLMIVSLFGILAYMTLGLRDIIRAAQAKQVAEQGTSKTVVSE